MRTRSAGRIAAGIAALALTVAVLPVGSATAAPSTGWKVGDCFAKANVDKDLVELPSKVDCAKPHAVQVVGGAALPSRFAKYSLAQMLDQKDIKLRAELVKFSEQICSGTKTASGIWPKQGAAVAKALTGLAATTGGGILPGLKESLNFGWVFPDAGAFNAGDRSMICVIYPLDPNTGKYVANAKGLKGDFRLLSTSRTLPTMRACFGFDANGENYAAVSCALPHGDELIANFVGKLPAAVADMTDEQWEPFDRQCYAILDALVGSKRSDLQVVANPGPETAVNALVYIPCFVGQVTAADGTRPNLPGGTVVGLGKKPLKTA